MDDLKSLRIKTGYTSHQAAELCGVSLKTYRRYERTNCPPRAVSELFQLIARGGIHGSPWKGWKIQENELISPEGNRYRPEDLRKLHWLEQIARHFTEYRKRVQEPVPLCGLPAPAPASCLRVALDMISDSQRETKRKGPRACRR